MSFPVMMGYGNEDRQFVFNAGAGVLRTVSPINLIVGRKLLYLRGGGCCKIVAQLVGSHFRENSKIG